MSDDTREILVLGGTGKTGRRVVEGLLARGLPVRVGSTGGDPRFDWGDRATWAPVMEGTRAVYISYYPDLAVPGAPAAVGELSRLAVDLGVRRLVLLSGRGEEQAERSEEVMRAAAAGIEWTVVRCSWFNQNFSEGAISDLVRAGELFLPVGDVPEPFVDADDIADVAVAALTEEGHAGQVYELTGPGMLTFAEAIAEISHAAGRPVRLTPISPGEFEAALAQEEQPDAIVWLLDYLFREVLDGRNAYLTDGVQRAIGRPPKDFADYAREAAASGVWAPAPAGSR
ncbi:MAG TPA: hypothetical protein VK904_04190 [Miltoncostaeaceae bacterium]|nr:hypothetical protein [Miltoncostaeaceae bacterium]